MPANTSVGLISATGYKSQITVYLGGHLFPNYIMHAKYFDLNHHLLSNYYSNYQNYESEHCNLGINVLIYKQ